MGHFKALCASGQVTVCLVACHGTISYLLTFLLYEHSKRTTRSKLAKLTAPSSIYACFEAATRFRPIAEVVWFRVFDDGFVLPEGVLVSSGSAILVPMLAEFSQHSPTPPPTLSPDR